MRWINKLKRRCKRSYLRASMVPVDEAPLSRWEHFAEVAPRWLVEETAEKWIGAGNRIKAFISCSYWFNVYHILNRRCESLERPILQPSFIEANRNRICFIPNNASCEMAKAAAERFEKEYPFFVVEEGGKFRGVAVTYGVILLGALNMPCSKERECYLQGVNVAKSLSLKDFGFLALVQDEVSQMLSDVGLEPLGGRYWWRSPDGSVGMWECWSKKPLMVQTEAFVISKM